MTGALCFEVGSHQKAAGVQLWQCFGERPVGVQLVEECFSDGLLDQHPRPTMVTQLQGFASPQPQKWEVLLHDAERGEVSGVPGDIPVCCGQPHILCRLGNTCINNRALRKHQQILGKVFVVFFKVTFRGGLRPRDVNFQQYMRGFVLKYLKLKPSIGTETGAAILILIQIGGLIRVKIVEAKEIPKMDLFSLPTCYCHTFLSEPFGESQTYADVRRRMLTYADVC